MRHYQDPGEALLYALGIDPNFGQAKRMVDTESISEPKTMPDCGHHHPCCSCGDPLRPGQMVCVVVVDGAHLGIHTGCAPFVDHRIQGAVPRDGRITFTAII